MDAAELFFGALYAVPGCGIALAIAALTPGPPKRLRFLIALGSWGCVFASLLMWTQATEINIWLRVTIAAMLTILFASFFGFQMWHALLSNESIEHSPSHAPPFHTPLLEAYYGNGIMQSIPPEGYAPLAIGPLGYESTMVFVQVNMTNHGPPTRAQNWEMWITIGKDIKATKLALPGFSYSPPGHTVSMVFTQEEAIFEVGVAELIPTGDEIRGWFAGLFPLQREAVIDTTPTLRLCFTDSSNNSYETKRKTGVNITNTAAKLEGIGKFYPTTMVDPNTK